eukprot:gnl/MRDRNA2_/MRDRNA2_18032_c0_seq1.p1 gnl/MRDRNA2_/MRDRNA2_18032_c0~~gnl/MRDRNA2_/MRDRNA2_18032_c0_seq1.p1  ORF type:complete len:589 (+),score=120.76 gnl/MRDRNA2_/MRDRNA2_18032_c0_seq1:98-1864(+)
MTNVGSLISSLLLDREDPTSGVVVDDNFDADFDVDMAVEESSGEAGSAQPNGHKAKVNGMKAKAKSNGMKAKAESNGDQASPGRLQAKAKANGAETSSTRLKAKAKSKTDWSNGESTSTSNTKLVAKAKSNGRNPTLKIKGSIATGAIVSSDGVLAKGSIAKKGTATAEGDEKLGKNARKHSTDINQNASSSTADTYDTLDSVCWDYIQGHCARGDNCKWSHVRICFNFLQGHCPRGGNCDFVHVELPDDIERPQRSRSRSPRRHSIKKGTIDFVQGAFWSVPDKTQLWKDETGAGTVEFRASLIQPDGFDDSTAPEDGYPLAFFFTSLGEKEDVFSERIIQMSSVAPEPFVLVCPSRPQDLWWFISDSTPWGWIEGDFLSDQVDLFDSWMIELANAPGVDPSRIGLFGFSAGAYAVMELFGKSNLSFSGVGVGGVHGHGQSSLDNIPAKRKAKYKNMLVEKFDAFLERVKQHRGTSYIEATHSKDDIHSLWEDAQQIIRAVNERQEELDLPKVRVRLAKQKDMEVIPGLSKQSQHNYFTHTFLRPEFFSRLLAGRVVDEDELTEEEQEEEEEQTLHQSVKRLARTSH